MPVWKSAAIVLTALAVAGCGGAPEPVAVADPEFRELPGIGNFAMIIPAGTDPGTLPGIAKAHCGELSHCTVFGWTNAAQAATAFPLTDAEVASQAFNYSLNRDSGQERALWNCAVYPQPSPDACLSADVES